ncbi:hypothetical protein GCM10022393_23620 [Aquimarina addita]|uniref:Uncharacterized protein n=1 Tax=Aquimarina addita TaxID=870485 RepID=A0ABP6UMD2_9FLAO
MTDIVISVFKTSICEKELIKLSSVLNQIDSIINWNTDLEDCDNILRIESEAIIADKVIKLLSGIGFFVEELLD